MRRISVSKRIFSVSALSYLIAVYFHARKDDKWRFKVSLTRRYSQFVGVCTNLWLPPYLRRYLYLGCAKAWGGIDFDELKIQDPNDFATFNDFFTRELKPGVRPISEPMNDLTMCSPCDGRILRHGDVNIDNCTIDCIKGHEYRLDEFLFGFKTEKL